MPKSSCWVGGAAGGRGLGRIGRGSHGDTRIDRVRGRFLREPAKQILHMDHAARIIQGLAEERDARNAGLAECAQQLRQAVALLEGDNVGAGHHDVIDPRAAEAQQPAQHLPLFIRKCGDRVCVDFAFEVGLEHLAQAGRAQSDAAEEGIEQALRAAGELLAAARRARCRRFGRFLG